MTDIRATQVSAEVWAEPIPPDMRITQVSLEMWGNVVTGIVQMVATQCSVEMWASVAEASTGQQARAHILA